MHPTLLPSSRPTILAALLVAVVVAAGAPAAATSGAPTREGALGTLAWSVRTDGPIRSTPLVEDGFVYVGGTDGTLHALELESGCVRWRYHAGAPLPSAPVGSGERILIRDRDGTLHAVRRADGAADWTLPTGPEPQLPWGLEGWDYVLPAPTVAGDRILFPGGDGHLYALEADGGRILWHFDTGARLRARPTVADGVVYFGDGAGTFRALTLADGAELWSFRTEGFGTDAAAAGFDRRQIYAAARVRDGVVYFGSRDAKVYALDAATGAPLWSVDDGTSGWVIATPTLGADRLFVARSSSTRVRALDPRNGSEVWSRLAGSPVFGTPLLIGDQLVVATGSGMLLGLDAASGDERWRYGIGSAIWAEPSVGAGRLVVGADDGRVYAFELADRSAPRLAVFWDDELVDVSGLGGRAAHEGIADWFESRGYARLDRAGLEAFVRSRERDGAPSAIVFAMDGWPTAAAADGALLRTYLDAGGRVVWLGRPPRIVRRDSDGSPLGLDREAPAELLELSFARLVGDRRPVFPTADGRSRGLTSFWIGGPNLAPGSGVTVLGADTTGLPVAWERAWPGATGGTFVQLYPTNDGARLDEIRRVVEHGIFRSPATRQRVAH